jgi:hypothetical protein
MKLRVVPDPSSPGGGFGYLVAVDTDALEASVHVQVFDTYSGRWLGATEDEGTVSVGDGNWQSETYSFGPYETQIQGSEVWIRIGPEIVNKIEEYTPLRLTVAGNTADLVWPDNVLPRMAPALVGEIQSTTVRSSEVTHLRPELVDETAETDRQFEDVETETPEAEEPSRTGWLLWSILLATLIAVTGTYFLWPEADTPDGTGIAYEPDEETETAVPCSHASISKAGGGYLAMETSLRECGSTISANDAIRLLEMGVREGSPDALLLFGKIYDAGKRDELIESTIGLTFEDDPATAAEYYHRAKAAGSPEAETLLIVTCERLSKLSSTLATGAFDDYCPKP